jgi:hypothetical protein
MSAKNLLILLLSSLSITGCTSFSFGPKVDPIEVQTVAVEKTPLNLEDPKPLKPKEIEWHVITPENFQEVFDELEANNISIVLYGLSDDDYQDLSMNLARLRMFILQQKAIIDSYREYYEPPEPINKNN